MTPKEPIEPAPPNRDVSAGTRQQAGEDSQPETEPGDTAETAKPCFRDWAMI